MILTVACGCGALTRVVAEFGAQLPPTFSCGKCGRAIGTFAAPPGGAGVDDLPLALQDLRVFDSLVAGLRKTLEYGDDLSPSVRQTIQDIADRAQRTRDELKIRLDDIGKANAMLVQLALKQ